MKKKKWIKSRHRIARNIAYALLYPYARLKYHVKIERFKEQGERPYLILFNHQTPFDQFFVGMVFKGAVYHIANEDLFTKGFTSWAIRFLAAPIPIKKQSVDIGAIRTCIRVAKEGGTIGIAPEGNRTYTGRTVYINPSIAGLAKMLGLPVALMRIEGGYGVAPRWSDVVRRGPMRAYVARVIEPEEVAALSKEDLYKEILQTLTVDDTAVKESYRHKKRAEYIERAVFLCPRCKEPGRLESRGEKIFCNSCGLQMEYTVKKEITAQGFALPFKNAAGWIDFQNDWVNRQDPSRHTERPLVTDADVCVEEIADMKRKVLRKNARLSLYGDRIAADEGTADEMVFSFADLTGATVSRKNKLALYAGKREYQLIGGTRFNALKYMNFYYRFKNWHLGDGHGEFLGH